MKRSLLLLPLLVLLLFPVRVAGTDLRGWGAKANFSTLTREDGLTSNNVYDLCSDRNGRLWLGTSVGLSLYDGVSLRTFFKEDMMVRSNYVNYVFRDDRDRIWVGTDGGVSVYDPEKEAFTNLEVLTGLGFENPTAWFFQASDRTVWVAFKGHGLIAVNPDTFETRQYFYAGIPSESGEEYFSRIWFEPENGLYLVASLNDGLFYADLETETLTPFHPADNPSSTPLSGKTIKGLLKFDEHTFYLTCMDQTMYRLDPYRRTCEQVPLSLPEGVRDFRRMYRVAEDVLAVVTGSGLVLYDTTSGKAAVFKRFRSGASMLSVKNMHCLFGTLDEGLVLGLHGNGLLIQQDAGFEFRPVRGSGAVSLRDSDISGFVQLSDTTVWVTTRQKGLFSYQPVTDVVRPVLADVVPSRLEGAVVFDGDAWLLSSGGIGRLSPEDSTVTAYREGCPANLRLVAAPSGHLSLLAEDGLLQYDPKTDAFQPVRAFAGMSVRAVTPLRDGRLLVHAGPKGLFRWDGKRAERMSADLPEDGVSPSSGGLLYEDVHARVWYAPAAAGIRILSPDGAYHFLTSRSGLYSDMVSNLIGDEAGNMFITTDRSLTLLPPTGKMVSVTKAGGLLNFGFSRNAALRLSSGDILLGSRDGFIRILPIRPAAGSLKPLIEIGAVRSEGEVVPPSGGRVVLEHGRNSFDIEIRTADPRHIDSGNTLYCLEGFDPTWVPVGKDGKVSCIQMQPGRYRLRTYDAGLEPLEIVVRPHPLRSPLAIALYALGLVLAMALIILYVRDNERRKREAHVLQMEIDLHEEKMNFFTGVAHEIKTPLTLITTPLSHVLGNPSLDADARYDLEVVEKNAGYLTRLVKELLELSKIEQKKYRLTCAAVDLGALLENVAANFSEQLAGKSFHLDIPEDPVYAMADASATMKIANNLIVNALKYSDHAIDLSLSVRDGAAEVRFRNDGPVIPADMREKVFENFTRLDPEGTGEGFGIGLSLARALATLQGGTLDISPRADSNEFILTVPLAEPAVSAGPSVPLPAGDRETVLLVEDHAELIAYLTKNLSAHYDVLTAGDGASAFRLIGSRPKIDLVITDLRMPKMGGLELCSRIKKDVTYSHILVVVLSANLTQETQIACMEVGADALVEKPFSMEFLLSRVGNLLQSRKRLIERLSTAGAVVPAAPADNPSGLSVRSSLLLDQVNAVIRANLSDPEFGIEQLSEELGISTSTLGRKLKDLLDTSAGNYIRDKRLEKAEELLRNSTLQVNEICYQVGFQTPSYFIKCFRRKYGSSPNEYAKSAQ